MSESLGAQAGAAKPPFGYKWRSSVWYITLGVFNIRPWASSRVLIQGCAPPLIVFYFTMPVVGVGIATDLGIYSMIIPVIPFRQRAPLQEFWIDRLILVWLDRTGDTWLYRYLDEDLLAATCLCVFTLTSSRVIHLLASYF